MIKSKKTDNCKNNYRTNEKLKFVKFKILKNIKFTKTK